MIGCTSAENLGPRTRSPKKVPSFRGLPKATTRWHDPALGGAGRRRIKTGSVAGSRPAWFTISGLRGGSVAAQEKPPAPSRRCGGFPSGRSAKPITRGPDARLKAIPEISLRTRRENARTPLPGPTECFGSECRSSFRPEAGTVAWPGERDDFRLVGLRPAARLLSKPSGLAVHNGRTSVDHFDRSFANGGPVGVSSIPAPVPNAVVSRTDGTVRRMEMRLEVVQVPVADVDASKSFYTEKLGFVLDHDVEHIPGMRVVQLTPPGSAASIVIGTGMTSMTPGTLEGLQLVVPDLVAVRAELVRRGADISEIQDMGGVQFAYFGDPDGNGWVIQGATPPVVKDAYLGESGS